MNGYRIVKFILQTKKERLLFSILDLFIMRLKNDLKKNTNIYKIRTLNF